MKRAEEAVMPSTKVEAARPEQALIAIQVERNKQRMFEKEKVLSESGVALHSMQLTVQRLTEELRLKEANLVAFHQMNSKAVVVAQAPLESSGYNWDMSVRAVPTEILHSPKFWPRILD